MWWIIGGIVLYVLVITLICVFFKGANPVRDEG
jgi:hypothetical protein